MAPLAELISLSPNRKEKKKLILLADIEEVSLHLAFGSSISFAHFKPSSGSNIVRC